MVGGGLAGLVAAHELSLAGVTVTLFEASSTVGGQIRTGREGGFVVEDGAEGFVAGDREVPALSRALGLGDHLVSQIERRSLLLRDGKLVELSAGEAAPLLGIQASEEDLGHGIVSLRDGMATLTDALAAALRGRATIQPGSPVTRLASAARGWRLERPNAPPVEAEGVLLALPPGAAADLIAPLEPYAAETIRSIRLSSNLSVSTAYDRAAVSHPLDASGIVVSPEETSAEGLRACAFSSSKFPNRAPSGSVLLRAFFRPDDAELGGDDRGWWERTTRVFARVLGIRGAPAHAWVARWPHALPLYGRDHGPMIEGLTDRLRNVGPLELAGSAYFPGGVPGAVRSGKAAARRILGLGGLGERRDEGRETRDE